MKKIKDAIEILTGYKPEEVEESGKCPQCKTMGLLNYGEMGCDGGDGLFYPFECGDCGCKGREWNIVKFDGMEITKRKGQ